MDGSRVNWKLLSLLCEDREKKDAEPSETIECWQLWTTCCSCSFLYRMSDYRLEKEGLPRALWYLFHDSPARRDDYTTVTGSTVFPLKFCATQWVEDSRVAERALEIWPNVEKYIKHVLKEPKSKQPTSASYWTIQKATKDVLVPAKLQVFVYISKVLKPFLCEVPNWWTSDYVSCC